MCVSKKTKKFLSTQLFSRVWSGNFKGVLQYYTGALKEKDRSGFLRIRKIDLFCDPDLREILSSRVYKNGLFLVNKKQKSMSSTFVLGKLFSLYSKENVVFSQLEGDVLVRYNCLYTFFNSLHFKFLVLIKCYIRTENIF